MFKLPRGRNGKSLGKTFTPEGKWGASVGSSTFPSTFDYNWGSGKVYGEYADYIGFTATATINVPRSGPVTFTIGSDDGSMLYLDGEKIINLWGEIEKEHLVHMEYKCY